ncbi:MAG: acyl-phosphate glycerol 3-phosphate acyltransferase, partial [Firmicutes bacterium]|nr:acyl-phosphate glycerol 3-phosphate acyltransferase [Bacillota bacterium]
MKAVIAIIASYLLGSISFGYLTGKLLKGIDIRQYGSGNAGTTNIQRTLGTIPALVVLLLDVGKGIVAVTIAKYLSDVSFIHLLAGVA